MTTDPNPHRNGDPIVAPDGTDRSALDDRARNEIAEEENAFKGAPEGLTRAIERFDREGRC